MPRKDKNITYQVSDILQNIGYKVADWDDSKSKLTEEIEKVLSVSSKEETGKPGYPDRIYINKTKKLLIMVEEKTLIKSHNIEDKTKGTVSGIRWYISRFQEKNLINELKNCFSDWKILGIAVSGDLSDKYNHKFSCFMLDKSADKIITLSQICDFVSEEEFLAVFNNFDEEKAVSQVSSSSKKINNLLRSIDSQKRPILLSALMICLYNKNSNNFGMLYKNYKSDELADNVILKSVSILKSEGIPENKTNVLKTELAFLNTDKTLRDINNSILKDILVELENSVIPLFNHFATKSNYDIIGRFYEEFLKYAGISNVKKGIVLTPRHITGLFCELIDLKSNDKILDICCGTGAFLIAGMNKLINQGNDKAKENLLGFEINSTMFICAVSNMLFRGDGKSAIFNCDSLSEEAEKEMKDFGATVGFINPPYSGKENKEDPTPKEITFLKKLLDNCSRYAVIIAPLSTYFKDKEIRNNILEYHTLKYVINMPRDLFQPNASSHTAIGVFETNKPFDYENDYVKFYDLKDDGFVLSKTKGRTDVYNKWNGIKSNLLRILKTENIEPDGINYVKTKIKKGDEWTVYAHSRTDYSSLCEEDFIDTVRERMIFEAKRDLGILNEDLSESEIINLLSEYFSGE